MPAGTQEEAAEAYDIAAIKFRGLNAVTNFDMSRYNVSSIASSDLPIGGTAGRAYKAAAAAAAAEPAPAAIGDRLPNQDYWSLLAAHQCQCYYGGSGGGGDQMMLEEGVCSSSSSSVNATAFLPPPSYYYYYQEGGRQNVCSYQTALFGIE